MASGISFAHVWQQDDMSDLDLVLTAGIEAQNEGVEVQILRRFPAHSLILSNSPFLKAQVGSEAGGKQLYGMPILSSQLTCTDLHMKFLLFGEGFKQP